MHVNFGVVADVDVDDAHYMARRGRSFGDDPELVADLTALLVEGHCRAGLAPVVKHFPNQGATLTDPHDADSVSSHTPAEWSTHGRIPYEGTRAPVVMTGHVRFDGPTAELAARGDIARAVFLGGARDAHGQGGARDAHSEDDHS